MLKGTINSILCVLHRLCVLFLQHCQVNANHFSLCESNLYTKDPEAIITMAFCNLEALVGGLQIVVLQTKATAWEGDSGQRGHSYLPNFKICISYNLEKKKTLSHNLKFFLQTSLTLFIIKLEENILWLDPFRETTIRLDYQEHLCTTYNPGRQEHQGGGVFTRQIWQCKDKDTYVSRTLVFSDLGSILLTLCFSCSKKLGFSSRCDSTKLTHSDV